MRQRKTVQSPAVDQQELLKRVEKLETEFGSAVNGLAESVKKNIEQVWANQEVLVENLKLIDNQVMIIVGMLEASGIKVPAPGEITNAQSDESKT